LRVFVTKPFQLPARIVDRFQRPPRHPLLMPESASAYKGDPLTNYLAN
jgi:hypothetical protein